jgi:hypothetical protein
MQTSAAVRSTVPGRSNLRAFSFQGMHLYFSSYGILTVKRMPTTIAAQIGKLIQTHHLHVALSVKLPPTNGPAIAEIPSDINLRPLKDARFSSGHEAASTSTDPDIMPAAPHPAIARPTISATDVGDVAQMRDPMLKVAMRLRTDKLTSTTQCRLARRSYPRSWVLQSPQ